MIGSRIREFRKSVGYKVADLAHEIGISQGSLSDIENNKTRPSFETIEALIRDTDVNPSWLFTGEGDMRTNMGYQLAENIKSADMTGEVGEGFVTVPRYEVKASAGGGAVIHSEQIVDHLSFRSDWIHNALGVSVKDLALINVTGDSMEPTLSEGDLILVDMSHRGMKDNAVYVLQLNGSLLVKRLQHKLDGSVIVKSDNYQKYDPETVPKDETSSLNIIGRVVWCGRRM